MRPGRLRWPPGGSGSPTAPRPPCVFLPFGSTRPFPSPPGSDTIPIACRPAVQFNPFYRAASLPVVTGRVQVPTMGDFPFAHLACLPAPGGDARRQSGRDNGTSEGGRRCLSSEPAWRAGQTRGPQHDANDAASKGLPRRILLAEPGDVGGDALVNRGSLVSRPVYNGSRSRPHRRRVGGTCGQHGRESREGLGGRFRRARLARARGISGEES